jgi:hypothetical protein
MNMATVRSFQLIDNIFAFMQNVQCVKGSVSCGKIKVGRKWK